MSTSLPDDTTLASGIRRGDSVAFSMFFNKYKRIVYYYSLKYLDDPDESEELVQSVFVSIWEHRRVIDKNKSLKSYLFRSVVNAVYNSLKNRAMRRAFLVREMAKPEGISDPYDNIFYNDYHEKLENIIKFLPPQQRLILDFRRKEGLSSEEIARKLNITVRTVENQIYRATRTLRKIFQKETKH